MLIMKFFLVLQFHYLKFIYYIIHYLYTKKLLSYIINIIDFIIILFENVLDDWDNFTFYRKTKIETYKKWGIIKHSFFLFFFFAGIIPLIYFIIALFFIFKYIFKYIILFLDFFVFYNESIKYYKYYEKWKIKIAFIFHRIPIVIKYTIDYIFHNNWRKYIKTVISDYIYMKKEQFLWYIFKKIDYFFLVWLNNLILNTISYSEYLFYLTLKYWRIYSTRLKITYKTKKYELRWSYRKIKRNPNLIYWKRFLQLSYNKWFWIYFTQVYLSLVLHSTLVTLRYLFYFFYHKIIYFFRLNVNKIKRKFVYLLLFLQFELKKLIIKYIFIFAYFIYFYFIYLIIFILYLIFSWLFFLIWYFIFEKIYLKINHKYFFSAMRFIGLKRRLLIYFDIATLDVYYYRLYDYEDYYRKYIHLYIINYKIFVFYKFMCFCKIVCWRESLFRE